MSINLKHHVIFRALTASLMIGASVFGSEWDYTNQSYNEDEAMRRAMAESVALENARLVRVQREINSADPYGLGNDPYGLNISNPYGRNRSDQNTISSEWQRKIEKLDNLQKKFLESIEKAERNNTDENVSVARQLWESYNRCFSDLYKILFQESTQSASRLGPDSDKKMMALEERKKTSTKNFELLEQLMKKPKPESAESIAARQRQIEQEKRLKELERQKQVQDIKIQREKAESDRKIAERSRKLAEQKRALEEELARKQRIADEKQRAFDEDMKRREEAHQQTMRLRGKGYFNSYSTSAYSLPTYTFPTQSNTSFGSRLSLPQQPKIAEKKESPKEVTVLDLTVNTTIFGSDLTKYPNLTTLILGDNFKISCSHIEIYCKNLKVLDLTNNTTFGSWEINSLKWSNPNLVIIGR